jgi:hypothetical protein
MVRSMPGTRVLLCKLQAQQLLDVLSGCRA